MIDIEKIREEAEKRLDPFRYRHTIGVADTAACLAMRYGEEVEKAYLAGLLHDIEKCMPDSERVRFCEANHLPVTEAERLNPTLLHAKIGAYTSKHEFGITDSGILDAITYHTTGRPGMTLLEKIIFTADYMEPNRDRDPRLPAIREAAFRDLDDCVVMILEDTIDFVRSRVGDRMDPMTMETYHYYKYRSAEIGR